MKLYMGLIRFLLAISVVIAHAGPIFGFTMIGGKIAVQSFFIISGFYMSLILNEKYTGKKNYLLYLRNRFLRIYPTYFLVLVITFAISLLLLSRNLYNPLTVYKQDISFMHPLTFIYLIFENIAVMGQDVGMFLDITKHGVLFFSTTLAATKPFVYTHLLIPQAWTLSIEFMFYILAPLFVKRKSKFILGIIAASLLLRYYLNSIGLHHEPWINKFFPTELLFFMLGILSYKIYTKIKKIKIPKPIFFVAYFTILLFTLTYDYLPKNFNNTINPLQWIYFLSIMIFLPFGFLYYKKSKIDKLFGDLSYPIYISHVLIFTIVFNLNFIDSVYKGVATIVLTIIFSIILFLTFIERIEMFRNKELVKK